MSESPGEQPSTGVLGRIGSWFSPWKGKTPQSPTENAAEGEEEEEEGEEESVRGDRQPLRRDIFPREEEEEEEDAALSARSLGSVGEGGPREEERAREENGASAGGNPERNALTHLTPEQQGVAWDSDPAPRRRAPQAQTGKRLHVYLEETSVIHLGQDPRAQEEEVVRTTVTTKSLTVLQKSKSSEKSSSVDGKTVNYSSEEGEARNTLAESKSDSEGEDRMGRKNASRRRSRKNSSGDGGNTPQGPTSPKSQPAAEKSPRSEESATGPEGQSPQTHEQPAESDSSPLKISSAPQASPEGGEERVTSCPVRELEDFQGSDVGVNEEKEEEEAVNMEEDDDRLYKVERKTETPESKRRSMKVSRSEVKLFTKYVPLNPKQSPAGSSQDFKAALKKIKEDAKEKTEADGRVQGPTKADAEANPLVGRLADKISVFENRLLADGSKKTFRAPRSVDVSPDRNSSTERLKTSFETSDQRSRSADRSAVQRPATASPAREKPMTIKERARIFGEASVSEARITLSQKAAMTGMSQQSGSHAGDVASKSLKLDGQGKLDTGEQIQTKAGAPDSGAAGGANVYTSKVQLTRTKTKETLDKGTKASSAEPDPPAEEQGDSAELSTHPQVPSRTGSRSKRRKSKEPTSPVSPNNQNKPEDPTSKPKVGAIKPENTAETVQQTEKDSLSSHRVRGNALGTEPGSDTKQNEFKKEPKESKEREIDEKGSPEVSRDEPDTAAVGRSGTKKPFDKAPVILPRKEEKAEGPSRVWTQEGGGKASEEKRDASASSPAETSTAARLESPAESHKINKESQLDWKGKGRRPGKKEAEQPENNDMNSTNQTKYVEESEKVGSEKTNQSAKAEKTFLPSDENTTKAKASPGGKAISERAGRDAGNDETKTSERSEKKLPMKDVTKPELATLSSEKSRGSSGISVQTRHVGPVADSQPEKEKATDRTVTESNEAVSGSKGDKELRERETTPQAAESPRKEKDPQPESVSVEKHKNSLDDSCAHGVNDAEVSSPKPITKTTPAFERETVKASKKTPELITALGNKDSSVQEPSPITVSVKEAGKDDTSVKSGPVGMKIPRDVKKSAEILPPVVESKKTDSRRDVASLKDTDKMTKIGSGITASSSTDHAIKRSTEDKPDLTPNGDISSASTVGAVKEQSTVEQWSPKAPTSPEANRPSPGSTQRSSMKKLNLSRGLVKDDSSMWQDAPSSWLDVDFPKRKVRAQEPRLTSSGSESNLLDTPDDDDEDFIERIRNLFAPFSLPPRKHNPLHHLHRPPQPPFALPAIREDRFEKVFDPEEFTFGLRKKAKFSVDTSQSLLSKSAEVKSALKPARASLVDRCLLLGNLDSNSRLRENDKEEKDEEEEGAKAEASDLIKVKSRLEGSCILNSLTSSAFRGRRNGALTEGTGSGNVSPTDSPQDSPPPVSPAPPPSPTNAEPLQDPKQRGEEVVSDSGPPLPSFNDFKLPDYLQKYLPQEPAKPEQQSAPAQDQVRPELSGKMTTPVVRAESDAAVKAAPTLPDKGAPCFPGIPPATHTPASELQKPQGTLRQNVRTVQRGFHKRPGKMVLFEKPQFGGQAYELHRDVADASALQLSPLVSVKVVRGCWILYEKPDFQGRTIALEEGGTELANMWADPEPRGDPQNGPPMVIGSIRLAVADYSLPHIDLFTEPEGRGRVTPYHDDTLETGSFGIPLNTASIQVHSGVWLVFSDPGFQGMIAVLERGVYPVPEAWGFSSPFIGSLRPLKMGGFKVENPDDVKAELYEKPGFEGSRMEVDGDVFSLREGEADVVTDAANPDANKLKAVGSLKITGGFWVGYSQPGFEGQQFILEEGEYLDWNHWAGTELLSLRPLLSDFMTPHLKMFSEKDFGKLGVDIELTVPVINMDDTGYGMKTQSVDVIGGVWVVFEEPGFCGELYVVEKGLYGSPEDWGATHHKVGSTMPVLLDDFENTAKFKVLLFSSPGFQGRVLTLEDGVGSLQDDFSVASCKVVAGSWLAFEGPDFTGKVYVLEEGSYSDLRAMGCVTSSASVLSLQPVGFEFSLPSVTLFERGGLRGKRVVLTDGSVNLHFSGGCGRVQSLLVEGGIWVLYEGINYRGAQILLRPGEVLDWQKFSRWQKIGSLRPLTQKQVHFHLRNKGTGLLMSVTGDLDDVKMMRIQETEETGGFEQIWFYHNGHLHCKLLEECCMGPIGSVTMAGSRVGLAPPPSNNLWSITPEGFIRYSDTSDLVLEVKGGHNYDKNQVILNTIDPNKLHQRWDVEII